MTRITFIQIYSLIFSTCLWSPIKPVLVINIYIKIKSGYIALLSFAIILLFFCNQIFRRIKVLNRRCPCRDCSPSWWKIITIDNKCLFL